MVSPAHTPTSPYHPPPTFMSPRHPPPTFTFTAISPISRQARELEELEVSAQLAGVSARERHRLKRMARSSKGRQMVKEKLSKSTLQVTPQGFDSSTKTKI